MNRVSILTLSILTAALASPLAHAEKNPCREIRTACEAAGFKKGGHKPEKSEYKGLFRDCVTKFMEGETVPGVNVSAEMVAACKAKKTKRGEKTASRAAGTVK